MPAAIDDYAGLSAALTSPIVHSVNVTPDDDADLAHVTRSIWIGTAGDLRVTTLGGEVTTYPNKTVGRHPIRAARIHATGTTASGIVAEW